MPQEKNIPDDREHDDDDDEYGAPVDMGLSLPPNLTTRARRPARSRQNPRMRTVTLRMAHLMRA